MVGVSEGSSETSGSTSGGPVIALRERLRGLAMNLWWAWNEVGQRPFAALDPTIWESSAHAPLTTIARADDARVAAAAEDAAFLQIVDHAERSLAQYLERRTWFARTAKAKDRSLKVAYFCSEFAVHESMQQYAGGLGVLAGDHLRSSSDLGVPLVGVGLLYRHGYYVQELDEEGATRVLYPRYDPHLMPISDTGVRISCPIGDRHVGARVWRLLVGRVPLYLLDSDLDSNHPEDRHLTEGLYKGDSELRMRQQALLGVGGILALDALNEPITVFHLNEGHAAFACVERLARLVERRMSLADAQEEVRASTVFTTHTPVPAGHDRYDLDAVARVLHSTLERAGLDARAFGELGRDVPGDSDEPICMTVLALRLASRVNGVAALHGRVTREMWKHVYGLGDATTVPIGHVTNGVHPRMWLHPEAEAFWTSRIRLDLDHATPSIDAWRGAKDVDTEEFWSLRASLRRRLVHFVRDRLVRQEMRRGAEATALARAYATFREDALTIGFARRFATYKRAPLIFHDLKRLRHLLLDQERPVQIVFAGKAHPRDRGGQDFVRTIFEMSYAEGIDRHVALIEEYDIRVARDLVAGSDVWLNNPIRPHEASGTSGMKVPLHGGINCSILDGWWPEGFDGRNGWAIGDGDESDSDPARRDARDAEHLYDLLEYEIIPEFYDRNRKGLPLKWIRRALRSASTLPGTFNTNRMVGEYVAKYYAPANRH